MRRRGRWPSRPALLLIEAVITVAIVSVSLVVIMRAFATGLRAMDQARRYETLIQAAHNQLIELEARGELTQQLPASRSGEFAVGANRFRWDAQLEPFAAPHEALDGTERGADRLVLTGSEARDGAPIRISLTTLVPSAWSQPRDAQ